MVILSEWSNTASIETTGTGEGETVPFAPATLQLSTPADNMIRATLQNSRDGGQVMAEFDSFELQISTFEDFSDNPGMHTIVRDIDWSGNNAYINWDFTNLPADVIHYVRARWAKQVEA